MKSFTPRILVFVFSLHACAAFANSEKPVMGKEGAVIRPLDMPGVSSESEYFEALKRIEQIDSMGQRASLVSSSFFQSLTWIGRTACVNYVCGILAIEQCKSVLDHALADDALVVRDHALRILLSTSRFTESEKRFAADRVVGDERNYRKGRPFWIVDRARAYLDGGQKNSARR